ncbi:MAG: 50S ribosomal protein L6 [Deltaproteobacteria bacterium]|nr:50S ribosomal protein L6 [Deltaproteobacteria bacterium]
MSRIGKMPIPIPKGVEIKFDGDSLTVKGVRGELTRKIHPKVRVDSDGNKIEVVVPDSTKESKSLHGLFRALISNMVTGVSSGFERGLEIVGVGYRAELKERTAVFNLGYSHPINFELPDGIEAKIDKMKITLTGADKELLGKTAAKIRSFRRPEPYKGKGIRYSDEMVRRKAGKSGAK